MKRLIIVLLLFFLVGVTGETGHPSVQAQRRMTGAPSVILQWFETRWTDIQKRLPEVARMGYGALYLPPPEKAGSGAASVGFDPADRFDLGDRLQYGTVPTKYGTTQELIDLIKAAHQLGLDVYFDTVMNHNANRAITRINAYPNLIPQDFHIRSNTDTTNCEIRSFAPLSPEIFNCDLLGLADLAQEDGNNVSGPLDPPGPIGLDEFGKPAYVRHPLTPQYYPSHRPVPEDAAQLLVRWGWWLGAIIGADGYRLDAVKHVPPAFFGGNPTQVGGTVSTGQFLPGLHQGVQARAGRDAVTFGEVFSGNARELATYANTGMGLLDFPLLFSIGDVFNTAVGEKNVGAAFSNPPRMNQGITFAYGGLDPSVGFTFVQNHDVLPPRANNIAYALVLTRPGRPIVFFDGNNIPDEARTHFPRPGRTDALGEGSDNVKVLVDFHNEFARGDFVVRLAEPDMFVFERAVDGQSVALIGINDRANTNDSQQATVQTAFPPGTVLVDYGGQMPAVTVGGDGRVTITVPSNNDPSDDPPGSIRADNNGRGFVLYAPQNPQGPADGNPAVIIEQGGRALPLQSFATADGRFDDPEPNTQVRAPVVRNDLITLQLQTDGTAASAAAQIDGRPLPLGSRPIISGSREGIADGFVQVDAVDSGEFVLRGVDLSDLDEGWHVVRFLAFNPPVEGMPPIFNTFTQVFLLDRPDRSNHLTDGKLVGDFAFPPIARQTVDPGDGAIDGLTELDALLVEADAQNLYIGVSGNLLGPFGSGMAIFIDVDFGAGIGLSDFGQLDDDSGPAPRLLSNTQVAAPEGFGAELAVATVGGAGLSSAPLTPIVSGPALPPSVGAFAGAYRINLDNLQDLMELPAEIAFDPSHIASGRPAAVNPSTGEVSDGLEVAIPLTALFPDGVIPPDARIAVFAYITDTGETGDITRPDSEDRILVGGRPPGEAFVTNQVLFGVVPGVNLGADSNTAPGR